MSVIGRFFGAAARTGAKSAASVGAKSATKASSATSALSRTSSTSANLSKYKPGEIPKFNPNGKNITHSKGAGDLAGGSIHASKAPTLTTKAGDLAVTPTTASGKAAPELSATQGLSKYKPGEIPAYNPNGKNITHTNGAGDLAGKDIPTTKPVPMNSQAGDLAVPPTTPSGNAAPELPTAQGQKQPWYQKKWVPITVGSLGGTAAIMGGSALLSGFGGAEVGAAGDPSGLGAAPSDGQGMSYSGY